MLRRGGRLGATATLVVDAPVPGLDLHATHVSLGAALLAASTEPGMGFDSHHAAVRCAQVAGDGSAALGRLLAAHQEQRPALLSGAAQVPSELAALADALQGPLAVMLKLVGVLHAHAPLSAVRTASAGRLLLAMGAGDQCEPDNTAVGAVTRTDHRPSNLEPATGPTAPRRALLRVVAPSPSFGESDP